ncbi:hypothetical protein ACWOIF_000424, partial [Vibrio vulnificus]
FSRNHDFRPNRIQSPALFSGAFYYPYNLAMSSEANTPVDFATFHRLHKRTNRFLLASSILFAIFHL